MATPQPRSADEGESAAEGSLQSPQGASHVTAAESAREHFSPIEQYHRYPVTEFVGETRVVRIHRLQGPTLPLDPTRYQRQSLRADAASSPGDEANGSHQREHRNDEASASFERTLRSGMVGRLMRPATVLAIVLLLLMLTVAGVVFVIQLLSVT